MFEIITRAHTELPIWFQLMICAATIAFCIVMPRLMWSFFFPRKTSSDV